METIIKKANISYQFYYRYQKIIDQGDLAFFLNKEQYKEKFKEMLSEVNNILWEKPVNYSGFWNHYMEIDRFRYGINWNNAYDNVIPVYISSIDKFEGEDREKKKYQYRANSQCFIYPYSFCINIMLDFEFPNGLSLEQTVKQIFKTYYENSNFYACSKNNNTKKRQYSLQQYADILKKKVINDKALPIDPIFAGHFCSIAFIDGIYPDYTEKIPAQSDVHEWLSKLFYFNESLDPQNHINFEKDNKFVLNKRPHLPAFPSSLYLEDDTNRILWMPAYFSENIAQNGKKRKIRTIKCYHKNLCMFTIQVKSLLIIVDLAYKEIIDHKKIQDVFLRNYVENTLNSLEKIYFRDPKTYKSLSSSTFLSGKALDRINFLRQYYFNKEPLHN